MRRGNSTRITQRFILLLFDDWVYSFGYSIVNVYAVEWRSTVFFKFKLYLSIADTLLGTYLKDIKMIIKLNLEFYLLYLSRFPDLYVFRWISSRLCWFVVFCSIFRFWKNTETVKTQAKTLRNIWKTSFFFGVAMRELVLLSFNYYSLAICHILTLSILLCY